MQSLKFAAAQAEIIRNALRGNLAEVGMRLADLIHGEGLRAVAEGQVTTREEAHDALEYLRNTRIAIRAVRAMLPLVTCRHAPALDQLHTAMERLSAALLDAVNYGDDGEEDFGAHRLVAIDAEPALIG